MAYIRYRVPYQVDVLAKDLTSSKRIGNSFFYRSGAQSAAPPAYGLPIAGDGELSTFMDSFIDIYTAQVLPFLSVKYSLISVTIRSMYGYGFGTPVKLMSAVAPLATKTVITTPVPHNLATGDIILITGVTTPVGLNGVWVATVTNTRQFEVDYKDLGIWSGNGTFQEPTGPKNWRYLDKLVNRPALLGLMAGDHLPIFSNVTVMRDTGSSGKNWRSKIAFAPITETDNDLGKLTNAGLAAWQGAMNTFSGPLDNGGTDPSSSMMEMITPSKQLAMATVSPFTESDSWCRDITGLRVHAMLGSTVRRKPPITLS